ncbi:MAG: tRNA (adenosine(37)-N6)-threonylcarbamoyltransferase complex ATPase subunit type 1 TsaE [Eubacteriales bacterium]|nr:tRNA (adenosine(37)-N6)-threonylcarbamoyltransferase complex ATPase subunit type 1 TsaE [Clostridiales bacterium]MDY5835916.1 tRNA (adenosine(37)-N6)-threonylcarbamoyltransferase complex ATPase subunit type 1 TsaE [Eubacteriales bacterium]
MRDPYTTKGGAGFRTSYFSHSPADTEAWAASLAPCLQAGDLIPLYGDLGAGKTCFARGLARGLGVMGQVASPSFTYLREHPAGQIGRPALYHFDCYRFHSAEDWYDLGFADYLDSDGVVLIEWPSRVLDVLPSPDLVISLTRGEEDQDRLLELWASPDWGKDRLSLLQELFSCSF